MKKGDIVYVIKWKYIEGKFTYYAQPMIYMTTRNNYGTYVYCRNIDYKDKEFPTDTIYASTFSRHRVFATLEEAQANVVKKQKEHDIKKKYEELAKKELEGL